MKRCSCHSASVYRNLVRCPACGHWSLDPGIGCERRKCGYEVPEEPPVEGVPAQGEARE